jgi:acyl-homoserine lactone acylase PvdQ
MKLRIFVCLMVAGLLCSMGTRLSIVSGQQPGTAQSSSIQIAGLQDRVTVRRD